MGSYSGNIGQPDRTRAVAGVVAVHALLAAIILTGLNVSTVRRAVEHMTTIDIAEPPPPPKPPPAPKAERSKTAEGPPAKRAEPTPIVAPPPKLPAPSPVAAAPIAGSGAAPSSGDALAGTGTGAGGSGPGGGGTGDTSRFTPARLVRNLSRRDYSVLSAMRRDGGIVPTHIVISSAGTVVECTILRSSGDRAIDRTVCQLIRASLRFAPARDAMERPIEYNADYLARWRPN